MFRIITISFLALFLAGAGCKEYRYQITMRRNTDGTVHREVKYFVGEAGTNNPKPNKLPQHILELYGVRTSDESPVPESVEANFEAQLPSDLRIETLMNFGSVGSSRSPLGEVFAYRERGPGGNRPYTNFRAVEQVVDTMISAWMAFAASQREVEPSSAQLEALEHFLRTKVQNDAMDLMLIYWQEWPAAARGFGASQPTELSGLAQRAILFLQERGYLPSAACPAGNESDFGYTAFEGLLRMLQGEMGGDPRGPLHPLLARLLDDGGTEEFEQGLCAIGLSHEEFTERLSTDLSISMFGDNLRADIVWQTQEQPLITNGAWDQTHGELRWSLSAVSEPFLPEILFAVWSTPDMEAQRKLFGKVLVKTQLPAYNAWYQRLSDVQRKTWDEFVQGFTPNTDPIARLQFLINRFDGDSPKQRELNAGAHILLSELRPTAKPSN